MLCENTDSLALNYRQRIATDRALLRAVPGPSLPGSQSSHLTHPCISCCFPDMHKTPNLPQGLITLISSLLGLSHCFCSVVVLLPYHGSIWKEGCTSHYVQKLSGSLPLRHPWNVWQQSMTERFYMQMYLTLKPVLRVACIWTKPTGICLAEELHIQNGHGHPDTNWGGDGV